MNGAAYDTCDSFKFGGMYIVVPCEPRALERNNERAKAKI